MKRFGDRDVDKGDAGAAHVGAPHDREGTGAGGEASGGTLAEGFRRRDTSAVGDVNVSIQHEWDARFARAMPGGPQA